MRNTRSLARVVKTAFNLRTFLYLRSGCLARLTRELRFYCTLRSHEYLAAREPFFYGAVSATRCGRTCLFIITAAMRAQLRRARSVLLVLLRRQEKGESLADENEGSSPAWRDWRAAQ